MAHLARSKKIDLIAVANELNLTVPAGATKLTLVEQITGAQRYDEELIKNLLIGIVSEREETEQRMQLEQAEAKAREFDLKKLELAAKDKIDSSAPKSAEVLKLMAKYNNNDEINIYLTLFERQIKRLGVEKEQWVTYLLGLLPLEIVNIIGREKEELSGDYDYVKKLLLKRFKLNPEQFRQKFNSHKKENTASWKDFAFELGSFLEEWLVGLEVLTYEDLKELLIIDQIRRKMPIEIKEHFVDDMPNFTKIAEFAEKLDNYEAARYNIRKGTETRNESYETKRRLGQNIGDKNEYRKINALQNGSKYEKNNTAKYNYTQFKNKCFHCNEFTSHKASQCPRRKEGLICYRCRGSGHRADQCNFKSPKDINTTSSKFSPFDKITKMIEINGTLINALIDSGSDVTMMNRKLYVDLGQPDLNENDIKLTGISGSELSPTGFFRVDILIDNIVINCDVYVLDDLRYDMILGNNCLNKLNFEISDSGLKVSGKRFSRKNYSVNFVTVVPLNIPTTAVAMCHTPSITTLTDNRRIALPNGQAISDDSKLGEKANQLITPSITENEFMFMAESFLVGDGSENKMSHVGNRTIRKKLKELVQGYKPNKTKTTNVQLNLFLTDELPIAHRPRRLAFQEQEIVDKQVDEWLREGIVMQSSSSFAAPVVLAKKKNGSHRLCIDYRRLNKKLIRDHFPLPLIEEILDKIGDAQVFTTLDLKNGFFHVEVGESSRKYTSFVTHNGQFEFLKMPFGISVCPSTFSRYINAVFRDLIRENVVIIYMDDLVIPARSDEEGFEKLKRVLQTASEYGIEFNFNKCHFLERKVEFLGYVIENGTVSPSTDKTSAIKNYPEPKSIKQLQSFLGLTSYFRKFIAHYAKIAKPLSDLLRSDNEFKFGPEQKDAFEILKSKLSSSPVLEIFKRGAELELHTDASAHGFGAVLLQKSEDGKLNPIYYMSKKTTPTQSKYSSYELEVLAVIEACKKFRNYLLGSKTKIVTDCEAFEKTMSKRDLTPKVARWALFLQEFNYKLEHRSAVQMKHVDALSRNAVLLATCVSDNLVTRVIEAQNSDEHIQTIKELINSGHDGGYLVKNDIVYKFENDRELLVIPENMQKQLIREIHEKGHFAASKTEAVLKQNYYIPNLKKLVGSVIANCVPCILCNRKQGKGEGLLNPIPKEGLPLETYHIDFIGPMPSTNKNYKHVFTVVDAFTKFVWFYPTKSTTTKDALDKLKLQQSIFGNPSRIIHDKGSAFTSEEFIHYCEAEGIERSPITTGVPRGNGQVEIIHRTFISVLSKLTINDPTKWYRHVTEVQRIINSTVTRSTKFTPFELMVGVKLKGKTDLKIKELLEEEYINTFVQERENNRIRAKGNILKIQEENKKTFDKKRKKATDYKVGDLVAIRRTQFAGGLKLRAKFFGPYRVVKKKKNDRYDVEKVGNHEGPICTSSAADGMKPWASE